MLPLSVLLLLAGLLQLWAGVATLRRKGELQSTQGRQLEAALGRRGTVAFFLVLGGALTGGGLFALTRALL